MINRFFNICIKYPKITLAALFIVVLISTYQSRLFRLDASSDTLIYQHDPALVLTQTVQDRFGVSNLLVISVTPKSTDLFSTQSRNDILSLQNELSKLDGVSSVLSYLDVPIFKVDGSLADALSNTYYLSDKTIDLDLAKNEFSVNELYSNFLVNETLTATAVVINLNMPDASTTLSRADKDVMRNNRHSLISNIRHVMSNYEANYSLFLGGISMISDDLITFIKKDLRLFGVGVFLVLIISLSLILNYISWILFPVLACLFSIIIMFGLYGTLQWDVTVISSNFVSVQIILTLALCLHLLIKLKELSHDFPKHSFEDLLLATIKLKFRPCLFAALTTIAGFVSLILSNILSVTTFGWMMVYGISISFIITFILFPSYLLVFGSKQILTHSPRFSLPVLLCDWVKNHSRFIVVVSIFMAIVSVLGLTRLDVENRFIDYFKSSTEIHQGLTYFDQNFGGTIPLDIVLTFPERVSTAESDSTFNDDFDLFDEYNSSADADSWFSADRLQVIKKTHSYLQQLSDVGKVLSYSTILSMAERLNNGPLDTFEISLLNEKAPDDVKSLLIKSYLSFDHNQARFNIRVKDSNPNLRRNVFLTMLENELPAITGLDSDQISISGEMVLYNNMLQSLFESQIQTLGFVLLVLFFMFWVLFRSLTVAIIGIIPNILAILSILGLMGLCNISLDLMTITIAAISLGIAVDDTIHYIYRFKQSFHRSGSYLNALDESHRTIGMVMFYTSVVIVSGFSILILSNFVPSIYFGLLTAISMIVAFFMSLTLLPILILWIKPFGPERFNNL